MDDSISTVDPLSLLLLCEAYKLDEMIVGCISDYTNGKSHAHVKTQKKTFNMDIVNRNGLVMRICIDDFQYWCDQGWSIVNKELKKKMGL